MIPSETGKLPCYSALMRTVIPVLKSWSFPKCTKHSAEIDRTKSGAKRLSIDGTEHETGNYMMIKPSEWTCLDLQFRPTWELMKASCAASDRGAVSTKFLSIDEAPVVRDKTVVLDILPGLKPQGRTGRALLQSPGCPSLPLKLFFRRTPSFPRDILSYLQPSVDSDGNIQSVVVIRTFNVLVSGTEEYEPNLEGIPTGLSPLLNIFRTGARNLWCEGDVCTLIDVSREVQYVLILVHHHLKGEYAGGRRELVCVPVGSSRSRGNQGLNLEFDRATRAAVKEIHNGFTQTNAMSALSSSNGKSYGMLANGMKYFIDRVLLYSDEFSQYGFKKGSAGGVYCISLSQLPNHRKSRNRVRVLTLTPPGISTAEGLRSIIPDPVQSSTKGRKTSTADGEEIMVFIDVVGYVCDYHEVSAVVDVVGCSGRAPCHLCSFKRFDGHPSAASCYGYSTHVHSVDACFARS